ncbi:MAG: hypothetical protein JNK12_06465 [Acidimicrobiales bacterium]|nr:hypothetical protein [Acidimicrobiales bacterium]
MTKPPRCGWCGAPVVDQPAVGRKRRYCRQSCRQQAYLARKLAGAHDLAPDEVVVRRDELTDLQDRVYALQAALEDVAGDLAEADGPADVRRALDWLVAHATPVAELWITPVSDRDP